MLFNSIEFLIFFPIVVLIYFVLPHKFRWVLLLLASYVFYASWRVKYLLLIIASTLVNYFLAKKIASERKKKKKLAYLLISIAATLGPLLVFKYADFFNESIGDLAELIDWNYTASSLNLLLPIGISFYTFQTLSYVIDVYQKKVKPEKHLGYFALYVAYFPQLVAGPIERPSNLLPQLRAEQLVDWPRIKSGLSLMLWGLFLKIVVADQAASVVNEVYGDVESYSGFSLVFATFLFTFQILGDFAGYSSIAIGAARVMGVDLSKNFDTPYLSKSISEFWSRWHITLSTWFRDYIYIPLGGSRAATWLVLINIMITFSVSGLWHGAAWTFIVWGLLHGFYIVFANISLGARKKLKQASPLAEGSMIDSIWRALVVFVLVMFSWVFFRAESLADAAYILSNLHVGLWGQLVSIDGWQAIAEMTNTQPVQIFAAVFGIVVLVLASLVERATDFYEEFSRLPVYVRWPAYYALIIIIVLFGSSNSADFIYFQF